MPLQTLKPKTSTRRPPLPFFMVYEHDDRGSSWPLYLVGALFTVGVMILGAWNLELPYLAFSTGPVSDAADAIVASEVDTYPRDGELLMLTVVSQDGNPFEPLIAV